ncbi:MAG: tetratricopeptide repeat protein [Alphaproteobacteria bacterium]|nr:tetratricopeptide repeat protein [Alphaproteobacteria bacterium]
MGLTALALIGAAAAQDFRAWQGLYEGLLIESSEGDPERAIAWYEGLISGLPDHDPTQGDLHFALGRTLYQTGRSDEARDVLGEALNRPHTQARAEALLGQIDALERRVTLLPLIEDFDDSTGHWIHSYQHVGRGTVSSRPPPGSADPALAWDTEVSPREDDQIRIWFDPSSGGPNELTLEVRAAEFPAYLLLIVIDDHNRWYTLPDFVVAGTTEWSSVTASLEDFLPLPLEASAPPAPLSPDKVRAVAVRDVTAYYSSDQGPNTIFLDRVRIR